MFSFTRGFTFLITFLTVIISASGEKWTTVKAVAEATEILRTEDLSKKLKKVSATAWLERVEKEELDLKENRFVKAMIMNLANKPNGAAQLLRAEILSPSGLPYSAAHFGNELGKLLPPLIRQSITDKDFSSTAPLLRTLLNCGVDHPRDAFRVVGRRLSRQSDPDASKARTQIAALIGQCKGLSLHEQDHFLTQLYGRKSTVPAAHEVETNTHDFPAAEFNTPQFLIMGGGGSSRNNQISLEKNVQFLQRVQAKRGLSEDRNHILFADGKDEGRDVQLHNENQLPELNKILASLLASTSGLDLTYRSHQIESVDGKSTEENLSKFLEDSEFAPDDQLVINFTGHGGRGEKDNAQNTSLYLWDNKQLRMKNFVKILDKAPEETPVMLLMVQCYSGGFANVIFKEGDPKKGLSDHPRCGFFATVHDRVAAGCTPAIDEEDYREYSSYFLAALHGESRTGKPVESADYDGDGQVCFAEAHAYAQLTSTTIDISIKTTDAFLRRYSQLQPDSKRPNLELVDTTSFNRLLELADTCDRTVLAGLADQLQLSGEDRVESARRLAAALKGTEKAMDDEKKKKLKEFGDMRKELGRMVRTQWPELSNPWHPDASRILEEHGEKILAQIKDHPKGKPFINGAKVMREMRDKYYAGQEQWAKIQRFIRVAENVALAANLEVLADSNIRERYAKLVQLEHGTLNSTKAEKVAQTTP